jgi:acyl-CoA reductase-like NAD-dependent aldehyde dehydrogenase
MRRIFIHENIYDKFVNAMTTAYKSIKMGDPLHDETLLGPLHTKDSVNQYREGIKEI